MEVCLLWLLRVVRYRSLRWAEHLSWGVLPSVVCPMSVIAKLRKGGHDPELGRGTRHEISCRVRLEESARKESENITFSIWLVSNLASENRLTFSPLRRQCLSPSVHSELVPLKTMSCEVLVYVTVHTRTVWLFTAFEIRTVNFSFIKCHHCHHYSIKPPFQIVRVAFLSPTTKCVITF
jgi:hypothetical protein